MAYSAQDVRSRRAQPSLGSPSPASSSLEPEDGKAKDPSYPPSWSTEDRGMGGRNTGAGSSVNGLSGKAASGPGGFKADPATSLKLTEGWIHHEKPKVYAKGKQRKDGTGVGGPLDELWDRIGGGLDLSEGELKLLIVITTIASFVRYWKIWSPSSVVCVQP